MSTLEKFPEFISTFQSFGQTYTVAEVLFRDIQKFVCRLYGQLSTDDVNHARFNLFSIGQFAENTMPCTKDVLLLHSTRASYQACIWKRSLQPIIAPPVITDFGWEINEGNVDIKWMTMPTAPDGILENANCGCKSGCSTRRCACRKAELKCTGLCSCCDCRNSGVEVEDDDDTEINDEFSDSGAESD